MLMYAEKVDSFLFDPRTSAFIRVPFICPTCDRPLHFWRFFAPAALS